MHADLTQEELAHLSGVPRNSYQRIERGTSDVKIQPLDAHRPRPSRTAEELAAVVAQLEPAPSAAGMAGEPTPAS
ncbi:helix-turn-helix transcriptional regulator [Streptomyces sp. NBC_01443]|uniref:helix-turn-helix transcriptional regulator n=1 Tax=Streptomyces sp. NBC_01443 TaxID=2903868 RepID=UPI00225323F2|nr:helix-turn-helix transcriptional regulator [Streptomyces sp. NBC_01443]MCX4626046.1 helix-turn-helix domain-containing protein [Streptomyces sp. NBC_01443]